METEHHPMKPEHLPHYLAAADGSDYLFTFAVVLVVVVVLLLGVGYLTLHALPERMAHKSNATQLQLVSLLAVLALFTHNNLFWILALLLAAFRPPDLVTPLSSMASSLAAMATKRERGDDA
ncbi:MAG: hypothetical protein AAF330_08395 [Pseudomonadota bacterium]